MAPEFIMVFVRGTRPRVPGLCNTGVGASQAACRPQNDSLRRHMMLIFRTKIISPYLLFSVLILLGAGCATTAGKHQEAQPIEKYSQKDQSDTLRGEIPPQQIKNVIPEYPPVAFRNGITGIVWVKVFVDSLGNVTQAEIVKEAEVKGAGFEEAAIAAAYKTKWRPAIIKGKPVDVWVTYKLEFNIR
jgi:TonB family protein